MTTFQVKQVQVPLFGVVDDRNQASWLAAFSSARTTIGVQVDNAALDFVAEELEVDAEGLMVEAERYVNGTYRAKARGIGGSQLGTLGEILTFLVNHVPGREIVRVVSWRAGAGQAVKGARFPQPDFIVIDASGSAALEVKSTEAFDFVDLRDATKRWTWLQPCSSVSGCRDQALAQLAFVGGMATPQQHSLVVRGGTIVPYPVGKGVAAAVVALDGRLNTLRSSPKYKTPPPCRQADRNCWSCIPVGCHFVIVTMPNAPGMLSLAGSNGRAVPEGFWPAYRRWSQALAARDLFAVRSSVNVLSETVRSWLAQGDSPEVDVLRAFWGSYIGDAMRSRGFDVEVPGQLGDLRRVGTDVGWSPASLAEPANRETSVAEIVSSFVQDRESAAPFTLSARLSQSDGYPETVSVRNVGEFVELHLVSETWWTHGAVETVERASAIAERLISVAAEMSGWPFGGRSPPLPLRKVVAQVGDNAVLLGWESKLVAHPSTLWTAREPDWLFWYFHDRGSWPPWPLLLEHGDPRVRIRIRPDGRADLRILRDLLRRR